MEFALAVLVAGGELGLVDEGVAGDIEASGGKAGTVGVDVGICEDGLGHVCIGAGVKAFGPVLGDETRVSRNVCISGLEGVLGEGRSTGEWCLAYEEAYMSLLTQELKLLGSMLFRRYCWTESLLKL